MVCEPLHGDDVVLSVLQRTEERDLRKAKLQEKKELSRKEALLKAIRVALSIIIINNNNRNCWAFKCMKKYFSSLLQANAFFFLPF